VLVKLETLIAALPSSGLRDGSAWLFSPKPLELDRKISKKITRLGHSLAQFQRAQESIYQRSAKGKLPGWIAELLDAGKPDWMVQSQRSVELRGVLPRVIRPDLILTGDDSQAGLALTELDSVPGGMGITLWLSQFYSEHGFDVLGGACGIRDGFESIFPAKTPSRILISEESGDYRAEMEFLASQCENISIHPAEEEAGGEGAAYRFFEWFDWQNIPSAQKLAGSPLLTPPCKPHLEEKLWLALLHTPSMRSIWQRELRGGQLQRLRELVPYGWVVDPTPLPPHAALPRLDAHSWDDVAGFSQKDRRLVLKVSGFSELAWGARGVHIGHDMPSGEWKEEIERAAAESATQPRMVQEFHSGKIVEHPYFDPETGEEKMMEGRVRLCPYYFTGQDGKTHFAGCLATIVPSDKKKIHGMKDGILVPCVVK